MLVTLTMSREKIKKYIKSFLSIKKVGDKERPYLTKPPFRVGSHTKKEVTYVNLRNTKFNIANT